MTSKYTYDIATKTANGLVVLDKLEAEVKASVLGVIYSFCAADELEVNLYFTRELTAAEITTLDALVLAHTGATTPQEAVANAIANAVAFGTLLMQEFATENVLAGYNTAQVKAIADHLASVQHYLQSGSLYVTLDALQNHTLPLTVDGVEVVSQAKIDNFAAKISAYLGL